MLEPGLLVRGVLIGLSIAAPVGPIGVLCIRRTLLAGRTAGLVSGLGAATADTLYGAVAGLGLTAVSRVLVEQRVWLHVGGGVFLLYLGVRTILSSPARQAAVADERGEKYVGMYVSTLALTLANPTTILSFVGVFAGLGIGSVGQPAFSTAAALIGGIFVGSALWWVVLSTAVALARRRVTPRVLRWVNALSGAVIAAFGAVALLTLRR